MTEATTSTTAPHEPRKLDDVMLAMDVVDTLRHDAMMLQEDLSAPEREQQLLERLREIYKAQGIEVPDSILREGVKALDDHRFAYTPQKHSFLSKAYITRKKWGLPLVVLMGMIGLAYGVEYATFELPKKAETSRVERLLTKTYPQNLEKARKDGLAVAKTATAKERINALYNLGMDAINDKDAAAAKSAQEKLDTFVHDLKQAYTVRIVSRPGENSGVFRVDDSKPDVTNYYLIVEAIDASGERVPVTITSEEDQKTARTKIWGVRVPKNVFNAVAADKRDDQIIQNANIGYKKRGVISPEYSVKTSGGTILEW
ncbi:MAG TPA: hypothetical protein ENJ42_00915 [Hellea balneolensis]|uniref:Uncharacterized protein n=1 Tax=Hellea balneolensis TaxID=287478 RepID=A0A7C5LYA8_9PROT|nr:hypothetical protein [Hellea balneolensis]